MFKERLGMLSSQFEKKPEESVCVDYMYYICKNPLFCTLVLNYISRNRAVMSLWILKTENTNNFIENLLKFCYLYFSGFFSSCHFLHFHELPISQLQSFVKCLHIHTLICFILKEIRNQLKSCSCLISVGQ